MKTITREITRTVVETVTENYITLGDFEHWLKDQRAYVEFLMNFARQFGQGWTLTDYFDIKNAEGLIGGAFMWDDASGGINYWNTINKKWLAYLKENNVKGLITSDGTER